MAKLSRTKGRAFEQAIARTLRLHFPGASVCRASQAERAHNPDVYFDGGPLLLQRLWPELTDARAPNPTKKLEQAERDVCRAIERKKVPAVWRLPVCVWHRLRERVIHVTMHLWVLRVLLGIDNTETDCADIEVTLDLPQFLRVVLVGVAREEKGGREEDARQDMKGDLLK